MELMVDGTLGNLFVLTRVSNAPNRQQLIEMNDTQNDT